MTYRNKQITIRIPSHLGFQIQDIAWKERISRNKLIEKILLKYFNMPTEISSEMTDTIWNKLNCLESKIENINNSINRV